MGNLNSSMQENTINVTDFLLKIDNLAAKFITSSNVSKNKKISDLYFCEDLVIMTSDVLANKLSAMDIEYLRQRTEKGVVIDDKTSDKIIFFKKDQLNDLDVNNKTQKRRICNGISRFYIKIAQLYAAILKSVNPVYTYTDENNKKRTVPLNAKSKIPNNLKFQFTQINLCNRRMNALLNGQDYQVNNEKDVFVHPDLCTVNISDGKNMSLLDEEGMVEFEQLFNDGYNFDIGKFDKMSDKMKIEYNKSLTKFYNAYTNNHGSLPEHIKKFSDIKLRQFSPEECKESGAFRKKIKGTLSEKLFEKYALHLREMYLNVNKKQSEIVDIVKQVFSIVATNGNEKVIVHPKLTYKSLEELIKKTQDLIANLYVSCEEDFLKGLNIFQEIILHHNEKMNKIKTDALKEEFEEVLTGNDDILAETSKTTVEQNDNITVDHVENKHIENQEQNV